MDCAAGEGEEEEAQYQDDGADDTSEYSESDMLAFERSQFVHLTGRATSRTAVEFQRRQPRSIKQETNLGFWQGKPEELPLKLAKIHMQIYVVTEEMYPKKPLTGALEVTKQGYSLAWAAVYRNKDGTMPRRKRPSAAFFHVLLKLVSNQSQQSLRTR